MRVSRPHSLRIDRAEVLRDVRDRLEEHAPGLAASLEPTNPAWIVLQEAAWMVESLTEQLDDYPWAVVQQFAHLLGAQLRPALPAVGVVCVTPNHDGVLDTRANPARWRFFTPQSEDRDLIEFVLAEDAAPVAVGRIASLSRITRGQLLTTVGEPERDVGTPDACAWLGQTRPSHAFARETIRYRLVGNDAAKLKTEVEAAIATFSSTRPTGWLRFDLERVDGKTLDLIATIDVNATFEGVGDGDVEDVTGVWAPLDASTWTPPVRVSDHPVLPRSLRGSEPMRAANGHILVPGVPGNMLRNELLVRLPRPAPLDIPDKLWQSLAHLDKRLAGLRPAISRGVQAIPGEPSWVHAALQGGSWHRVAEHADQTLAHIELKPAKGERTVRVGWITRPTGRQDTRGFAVHPDHGLLPTPLEGKVAWDVSLPDPQGRGMLHVRSFDVTVPAGAHGVLLAITGQAEAALLNSCLVVNAPLVRDGRSVEITRAIPEPISLLFTDVVSPEVIARLSARGLHPSAAGKLRELATSLVAHGDDRIVGFRGISHDPAEGSLLLNAPDAQGRLHRFKRGTSVEFRWYRRTNGAAGNVGTGQIRLAEQAPSTKPRISAVSNPLPTGWGEAREREEEAVRRVFGPQTGVPVTPSDWERLIRGLLGQRAESWTVRVWGYAERSLMSHTLWPPHDASPVDEERERLARAITNAGPETLLVVLGPTEAVLSQAELEHAQRVISALVRDWSDRIPAIRQAIVTRVWGLTLDGATERDLPTFTVVDADGHLVDRLARRAEVPTTTLLLNGVLVAEAP